MSRPESPAQPEWRIRFEARFTPTVFIYLIKTFYLYHFLLGFSIMRKHFQMIGPQTFTPIQFVTKWHILPLQNDTQNNSSKFNSLVRKISQVQRNDMQMTGYILILRNFLYEFTLLDLAFFPVYLKPVHR